MKEINSAIKELEESENIIKNSAHFMQFTIQDMLDSALLKAGKFRKNQSEFNVSQTVKKVIDMQKTEARRKGVSLCYKNLTHDDALLVNSDEQRVM